MSVAVGHFKAVMDVITRTAEGATASEVASELKMGRQAAVRLLDAMVREGIAHKEPGFRRYRVGLTVYEWGTKAVAPHLPSPIVRQEIASLAESLQVQVFYTVLEGTLGIALERTDKVGSLLITVPHYAHRAGPFHWSDAIWGKLLVAFLPPDEQESLLSLEQNERRAELKDITALRQELRIIRQQRYADGELKPDYYAVAAPVFDGTGRCIACVVAVTESPDKEEREHLVRRLTDAVSRASYYVGYSPVSLAH